MSRLNGLAGVEQLPVSAPSEALLFARAITGNPRLGSTTESAGAKIDCEYLEWLAAISPEYERRLRNLAENPRTDAARTELPEWLADISPEHARQLRELQREEAIAAEVRERSRRILERLERAREGTWDAAKHPRLDGPPNAGWFASTGASTGIAPVPANPTPKPDVLARPPRQQDELAQAPPPAQGGQQTNPPAAPPAPASAELIGYVGGRPRLNPFGYSFKVTYEYGKAQASQVWAQKADMTITLWDDNGNLKVQHSSALWDLKPITASQATGGKVLTGVTDRQQFNYQALVAKAIDAGIARNALASRLVAFEVEYRADQWAVPNKGITIATRDRGNIAYDSNDYADSRVAFTATESYDIGQGLGVGANATLHAGFQKLGAGVTLPQPPAPQSSFSWKVRGTVLGSDRIQQQSTGLSWNQARVLNPRKLDEPPAALQEIKLGTALWK